MASHGRRFATKTEIRHKIAKARRHARANYIRKNLQQVKRMQVNMEKELKGLRHSDYEKATEWKYRENKHLHDVLNKKSSLTEIRRVKTAIHSYETQAVHNRKTAKTMYQTSLKALKERTTNPKKRAQIDSYMQNPRAGKKYASGVFDRMKDIQNWLDSAGKGSSYNSDLELEAAANTSTVNEGLKYLGEQTNTDTSFTLE